LPSGQSSLGCLEILSDPDFKKHGFPDERMAFDFIYHRIFFEIVRFSRWSTNNGISQRMKG
jgi:hypothetical protein